MKTEETTTVELTGIEIDILNPRLPTNVAVEEMVDDILRVGGITDPLDVELMPEGLIVRRGNRRTLAGQFILLNHPEEAELCFPNGEVAARVHEGLTGRERAELICDHGVVRGLVNPHEIERSAALLFEAGATEADVAIKLSGLLEILYPLSAKNAKTEKSLVTRLKEARDAKLIESTAELEAELHEFYASNRRGKVQGLKAVWRCPQKVMEARFFHATSGLRNDEAAFAEDEYIPILTLKQCNKLWKAFEKDLEITDTSGKRVYSKDRPGPDFNGVWVSTCNEQEEAAGKPKTVRPKAMGAKAIKEEANHFVSNAFVQLSKHHAGETVEGLQALDRIIQTAELVSKHRPDDWEAVEEIAQEIRAEFAAKDKEAAEAAAEAQADEEDGSVVEASVVVTND